MFLIFFGSTTRDNNGFTRYTHSVYDFNYANYYTRRIYAVIADDKFRFRDEQVPRQWRRNRFEMASSPRQFISFADTAATVGLESYIRGETSRFCLNNMIQKLSAPTKIGYDRCIVSTPFSGVHERVRFTTGPIRNSTVHNWRPPLFATVTCLEFCLWEDIYLFGSLKLK